MKILLSLSVIFVVGGTLGWLLEFFYRRYAHGKWINPGFLCGPCLPLYGSGLILLYGLCLIDYSFIASKPLQIVVRILVQTVILTAIEYVTGLIFTKAFHVSLWDYSSRWGNIGGIICPLFSVIWGAVGALYSFLLHPWLEKLVPIITGSASYTYFLGIYMGVWLVDICYSFHVVAKIKAWAAEQQLTVRYENLKVAIVKRAEEMKKKRQFQCSFRSDSNIREELENYRNSLKFKNLKQRLGKRREK